MAPIRDTGTTSVRQRGSFRQGTTASFLLVFTDIDGNPYDPENVDVYYLDPDGTEVGTGDPRKMDVGEYVVDYTITTTATTGLYTFRYVFDVNTEDSGPKAITVDDGFIVVEDGDDSVLTGEQYTKMRNYLESIFSETQRIPVKFEPARFDTRRRKGKLTFPRWNQVAGAEIRRNNTLVDAGFNVDWLRGEITFSDELEGFDNVDVCYNFRWFTDDELDAFMDAGIQRVNSVTPFTEYTMANIPLFWYYTAMKAAAVDAIRAFMFALNFQQPTIVFGGDDKAMQVFDKLNTLKQNYEEEIKYHLEQKKLGPYPNIAAIVAPEMSLPGGRSRWFRYLFKG